MLLTSGLYLVFLICVFFAYWLIAERFRWRLVFLLGVSYSLYVLFNLQAGLHPWKSLLLLFVISNIDFTTTRLMAQTTQQTYRKLLLAISLASDIGILCVFKYTNFFLDSIASGLHLLGATFQAQHVKIIAPIGISFFIFVSIAYVVDVFRKDIEPAQSYFEYLSFVSFFPTLVAGPILRARQLFPQLRSRVPFDAETGGMALFLIAIGFIKKVAIADYLAVNFIERIFDFPDRFSSLEVLVGVYAYALQIYADFSGYSDIAIGSALLLGFKIPENFNLPYRSRDLPEFWNRWHITLSHWLRDYVFFTVVRKRPRSKNLLYLASLVTMLVGGLWHGPTWTFVLWGFLHGMGLVIVRAVEALRKRFGKPRGHSVWSRVVGGVITFHFVCAAWVFFRAEKLEVALGVFKQISRFSFDRSNLPLPVIVVTILGFTAHWLLPERTWDVTQKGFVRLPALAQALVLFILAVGLYYVASTDVVPFIYTKF